MTNRVTLYIAEHNTTKKKYFGKTTKWFTEEDLQKHYHGSGTYWNRHLKKHGRKNVTMSILGIFNIDEVENVALKFSKENNIVESNDWANLILENGLYGGKSIHSEETKRKISKANKGRIVSATTIEKIRKAQIGKFVSEETRIKLSKSHIGQKAWNKGIPATEEAKEKQRQAILGKKHTEETKLKMCKPKQRIKCPYCDVIGGISVMHRWHFDNCKFKDK